MTERDILYQRGAYWVKRAPRGKGHEVYRDGITVAIRVAVIGYDGPEGMRRAIAEVDRRDTDDRIAASVAELSRERLARGECRHCGGRVPCASGFGDVEVGVRWMDLPARERRKRQRHIQAAELSAALRRKVE